MGEIRMNKGEFMYRDRCGTESPLICPHLAPVLLLNLERFMLGEITAERHEEVYLACLEEEESMRTNQERVA